MKFSNKTIIAVLIVVVSVIFLYKITATKPQVLGKETHRLTGIGTAVQFASHQCDNGQPCSPVTRVMVKQATQAIHTYAKNQTVELTQMSEVNRKNLVYFCADNDRCWSYDVKLKQVTSYMQGEPQK